MSETPEVLQGRLGWEDGDISEAKPEDLEPHPKNSQIYGDTEDVTDLDETFRQSVAEKGVLEPLVITNGKQIISGHRRWLASRDAGLGSVPVRYADFDSDLSEREALIEFNRQREKKPGQIVNEYEEMLAIESLRGNLNKGNKATGSSGSPQDGKELNTVSERAADKINAGYSGDTLEKGREVKDRAEDKDEPEPVREAAKDAWDGLQSGEESFNSAYEQVKEAENTEQSTPELPKQDYDVLVADPPWRYDFSKTSNREVETNYATMSLSDIKELSVPATSDAVLYLWATAPKIREAFEVIDAWGFEYKTNIVWDKQQIGMGYWARGQHEHLLIAAKGEVSPPDVDDRRSSVLKPQTISEKRREHSQKPDCVLDMIAEQHEHAEIIEMFARDSHEAVDSWGAEAPEEVADDD